MKNLKVMNNTLFNTSMKQSIKYICMFLMLVGMNGNVWGTTVNVTKGGNPVSEIVIEGDFDEEAWMSGWTDSYTINITSPALYGSTYWSVEGTGDFADNVEVSIHSSTADSKENNLYYIYHSTDANTYANIYFYYTVASSGNFSGSLDITCYDSEWEVTGTLSIPFTIIANAPCSSRTLSFANSDVTQTVAAGTYSQTPTASAGSGTISYELTTDDEGFSINPSTGVVSFTGTGEALITATIAANGDYCEASNSYYLTITNPVYNDYKFACVDPVEAEVTQWTQKDIEVVANIGTANKVVAKMGSTTTGAVSIGTPKTTNTYTFTFNTLDFSEKENKSMILYWRNGSTLTGVSLVTLPNIISLTAGEGGSWDGLAIAPTEDDIVVINEPMTIDVADARAKEVVLKGSGSLTIRADQALIVDSKISKFADGAFGGTSSSDLVILSDENGTGALITGEESNNTQATVQFYTKAYKDATHGWVNQYFGIPFENTNTGAYAATGTYLYEYTVSSNSWTNIYSYAPMRAFHAYNILRRDASAGSYWLDGTLNFPGTTTNKDHVVNFTRRAEDVSASIATDEMFANSWTAPIDVTQMETTDFVGMDAELFIFNAGTASQVENAGGARGTSAGQWQNMPIVTVKAHPEDFGDYTVIPSMQAVMVHITGAVNDPHTLTLDYKRLVYEPAASDVKIKPLHAPRQLAENSTPSIKLHMDVTGESGYGDRVMTYIGQEFTSGYDNGCDGRKIGGAGYAPKFYAITEDGNMSINSVPEIEGQLLGFKAGSEDDVYTLTFQYTGDQTYYLNDMKEQVSTPITDASSYTFYSTPDDEEARFIISKTPYNSPSIATGMDELNTSNKARKQMIDGILYIIRDGRIYSAEGSLVK